jgi:hypothetical protein
MGKIINSLRFKHGPVLICSVASTVANPWQNFKARRNKILAAGKNIKSPCNLNFLWHFDIRRDLLCQSHVKI